MARPWPPVVCMLAACMLLFPSVAGARSSKQRHGKPDRTAPTAPSNLSATPQDSSVKLAWNASTDNVGVTGYKVYREASNGTWPTTPIGTTSGSTLTYTDGGLINGTKYSFRVTAFDAAGNQSSPSNTVSATPQSSSTGSGSTGTGGSTGGSSSGPCGTSTTPLSWQHVVWIVFENKTYSQIIGSSNAPYINSIASKCGLATNFFAEAHPSLPNYIAMTSGSTQGITDDSGPSSHQLSVPSIFSQLGTGGWRSLEESMPSNCAQSDSGLYAVRHNPAAYYTNIRTDCNSQDVPLGSTPDISARFTFITPNLCHDMHSSSCATDAATEVKNGDTWLSTFLPKLLSSAQYQLGSTAIFITWDEDDYSSTQHIPTLVISSSTRAGSTSGTTYNHYSMLRTTEEMLGLNTFLGGAAGAASMRSPFGL